MTPQSLIIDGRRTPLVPPPNQCLICPSRVSMRRNLGGYCRCVEILADSVDGRDLGGRLAPGESEGKNTGGYPDTARVLRER